MSQDVAAPHQQPATSVAGLGFWIYLMTDCVLFASLFATYAVLHNSTFGGVTSRELFSQPFVLIETLILLTSSFTCGVSIWAAGRRNVRLTAFLLGLTIVLGVAFLTMELSEFHRFAVEGHGWQQSAFLSSFFTLVGTHGAHIAVGLLWAVVLLVKLMTRGLTSSTVKKLTLFSLFWHFLDVIWIFIFTIVFLMGGLA